MHSPGMPIWPYNEIVNVLFSFALPSYQLTASAMEAQKRKEREPCPRQKANFLSYIIFGWTIPIFFKGYKKELNTDDLYQPLREHKSDGLGDRLCEAWENEQKQARMKNRKPKLLRAGFRVFGWEIALLGLVLLTLEMLFK